MSSGPVPTQRDRPRRRLGPGLTAFVVVDVVLVLVLAGLGIAALAERGSREPVVAPPSSSPAAEESPDATAPAGPDDAAALEQFVLPSGNIWCAMGEDEATCTILSIAYDPPAPREGCDVELGHVIRVTRAGDVEFTCEAAQEPPADATELAYGEGSTIGEMSCLSSRNGAHCRHDPSGAGFTVARAGVTVFEGR